MSYGTPFLSKITDSNRGQFLARKLAKSGSKASDHSISRRLGMPVEFWGKGIRYEGLNKAVSPCLAPKESFSSFDQMPEPSVKAIKSSYPAVLESVNSLMFEHEATKAIRKSRSSCLFVPRYPHRVETSNARTSASREEERDPFGNKIFSSR